MKPMAMNKTTNLSDCYGRIDPFAKNYVQERYKKRKEENFGDAPQDRFYETSFSLF